MPVQSWLGRRGQNLTGEFMQGAAHELGSGAMTLIVLWWETRH
ncbi:hypothetical protein ACFY0F_29000 [Streptomyces sp. NPDC001544]